jgi:hypothetical protein
VVPVTPISFREYVKAKIPFYSFPYVSEDSIIGDPATTFRSIGQLDRSATMEIGIRLNRLGKPVGCSNCEQNICDTVYVSFFFSFSSSFLHMPPAGTIVYRLSHSSMVMKIIR